MKFTPTPEQTAIVTAAVETKDNLLISALAGAAKSSTLELIAHALPSIPLLFLAFNKKIADELKSRMPANATCMTLNSLGHRAWGDVVGTRLTLEKDKCARILKSLINELPKSEQEYLYEIFGDLLRACSHAKGSGHVPDRIASVRKCTPLMDDQNLIDSLDEKLTSLERGLLLETLYQSMNEAFSGVIDFNDQLLMPTVFRASFPSFPLVLVDEAQDLSELNHAMLAKVARKRLIAVGDQFQAIYAFRGAHEEGMAELRDRFDMTTLSLTTTFRCPSAIVDHVRWRANDIQAWPGHPHSPGLIDHLSSWTFDDIPDGAAIICRNNAPLFSVAIGLLKSGRYPQLWGNDIGASLVRVMEKFGARTLLRDSALSQLRDWHEAQSKRVKNQTALKDKVDCIRVFLDAAETLGGAVDYAQTIFRSSGRVHLMTGHKSKGHEFDHVFFLNEKLVRDEGQDPNLRYVITTRAKRSLTYIATEGLMLED